MKKPPPGMNNMPLKPGETKSQYMDRVRATKSTGTTSAGPVRGFSKDPGTGAPKPRVGGVKGGVKGGMAPIDSGRGLPQPPKPRTPVKPVVTPPRPISPKGGAGTGGGRGTAPRPGYGGGKPRRMKTGGMVKGKK